MKDEIETSEDIINELIQSDRWLGEDYKNSKTYSEYLKKVSSDLIKLTM